MVCCCSHVGRFCSSQYWVRISKTTASSQLTKARFKGAYCTVWEQEPLQDLFGEMEVRGFRPWKHETFWELRKVLILGLGHCRYPAQYGGKNY